ncbi:MAG: hypothetical protein LPK18_12295 [Pseudomonadaceae bacterium]|nr:hypothetical protein [Pseudomonadaceae bacterium]
MLGKATATKHAPPPAMRGTLTVCWLVISAKELIQHPEKDYINEMIGLFLAIAGLSQIGEAKKDILNFFKTVVIQISTSGEVVCQEHWKRCLGLTPSATSKAARNKLARLIRDGHLSWVIVEDEKVLTRLKGSTPLARTLSSKLTPS